MSIYALMRLFTIRFRMLGAIAVVLGLMGLLGGVGMFGMFRIHTLSENFLTSSFTEAGQLGQLRAAMGTVRGYEKDILLAQGQPDAAARAHTQWLASLEQTKKILGLFIAAPSGPHSGAARSIQQSLDSYRGQLDQAVRPLLAAPAALPSAAPASAEGDASTTEVASASAVQAAPQRPLTDKAAADFAAATQLLEQLDAALQSAATASVQEQEAVTAQMQWLFALAVLLTILVVVPLTLLNMVSICRPLVEAQRIARAMAGGDLSQPISVQGRDEVADLQRALGEMQQGLGALVAQVRDASGNIASASQEIASGNHDLSQRTEQTASNVQSTVSALAQLTTTVQQTASSSQIATQLATSASGTARHGGAVVQQAVVSMGEITASSRKISDIIGLIDSIAFQTNILALNAAVEAARAGEQGRGFAVVASEVRHLAQRSAAAASDIKALISTSVAAVDGGVRHVEGTGSTMQDIVHSVQRVGDIIGEISAAATEQTVGIAQVGQSVGEIDRMTQQNAALVEQSAAAAESLREQAQRLAQVVQQFHLSDGMQLAAPLARVRPVQGPSLRPAPRPSLRPAPGQNHRPAALPQPSAAPRKLLGPGAR